MASLAASALVAAPSPSLASRLCCQIALTLVLGLRNVAPTAAAVLAALAVSSSCGGRGGCSRSGKHSRSGRSSGCVA